MILIFKWEKKTASHIDGWNDRKKKKQQTWKIKDHLNVYCFKMISYIKSEKKMYDAQTTTRQKLQRFVLVCVTDKVK